MTDPQTIPVFSPEGKLAQVSVEKYPEALKPENGFTPAVSVTTPEGQDAYLPHDKVDTAIKNYGFALGPSQQQPRTKMYTSSGKYVEIPQNAQPYAEQQGYKLGVQMTSPSGIELTVHPDDAKKALDLGWGIGPAQQQEKPGFLARTVGGLAGVSSTDIANSKFKNSASGKDVSDPLYTQGGMTYGKTPESEQDILKYAGINPKVYSKLDDSQKHLVLMEAKAKLNIPWEDKVAENLPVAGAMVRSGAKAVQSAKKGQYSEAFGHGLAAPLPLIGAQAEATGEELGQGHILEGLKNAALTLAPFVAEPTAKLAGKLDFSTTPRSPLSKVVMPDDVGAFHTAENLAKPSIVTAAKELGNKLQTADDAIQAIKQAKQNALVDAHNSAGPGKTVVDLTDEDKQALSQKLQALDAVQKHIEDAATIAKDAPDQPTKKEAAQKILTGAAKMAGGVGLANVIPGGHWGLEIAGVGWGLKDLGGGLHDLVRSPILNEERLNGAIKDTFSSVKPESRVPGVEEPIKTPSNAPYTGNRTVAHETTVGPPTQPGGDLNVTPDETLYPGKPEIKPPTPDDVNQPGPQPSINVPKTAGRDPKTGRFTKAAERGSSTTEEDADSLSKLPRIQVGTAAGAQNDTALFQQAKQNLGPDASFSQIAQEAQRLKLNQPLTNTPDVPENIGMTKSNKIGGYNPAVETEGLPSFLKNVTPRAITDTDLKKTYLQYDIPRLKKLLADASEEDKPYYQSMIDQLTEKQKNMRGSGKVEEASQLPFFSRAAETVKNKLAPWFSPEQALNTLKNAGVSSDELDIVKPWLDQQGKKVQKQALLDHIEDNGLKVSVTMKDEGSLHPEAQAELDKIKDPNLKRIMGGILKQGHLEDRMQYDTEDLQSAYGINKDQGVELNHLIQKFGDLEHIHSDVPSDMHKFNLMVDQAIDEVIEDFGSKWNKLSDEERNNLEESPEFKEGINTRAHELYREAGGQYGGSGTQYEEYTLPGGKNYREMLIQAPMSGGDVEGLSLHQFNQLNFHGGHFDEPNVLAHVRMNDRVIDGKKTLFVEEAQSDWHQQGRENGYTPQTFSKDNLDATPAPAKSSFGNRKQFDVSGPNGFKIRVDRQDVTNPEAAKDWVLKYVKDNPHMIKELSSTKLVPDAPFKKDWHELAMKQVLDTAVREGYDQVGWTTGKQQIDRYEEPLRQNVDEIRYSRDLSKPNSVKIEAFSKSNDERFPTFSDSIPLQGTTKIHGGTVSLDDVIGKEMAQKVRESKENGSFKGEDLAIGGSGMKGFYDEILPQFMNRYTKKWGGRVKDSTMQVPENQEPGLEYDHKIHTIEITPKMKEEILKKGQPISGLTEKPEEVNA